MVKNCYIHIPFCESICSYCDFCKMFYNKEMVDKYLIALEHEINSKYKGNELDTIYIGGGTPSSLSIEQLERLFKITDKLNKSKKIEFTIESNISQITEEKLILYKKHGVNRISIGIESIDKNNLKILERTNDKIDIKEKIKLIRSKGINNINVDLIYALPNETLEVLKEDLFFILSLDIEHISTYSLIIEKNTKLYINNVRNISEDIDYEMYRMIVNVLKENKYNHYEISNFSKEGYESKHNKCYWLNNEYYGFGLGASSYINKKRSTNTRSISKYLENKYENYIEELNNKDIEEYEIILGLRLIKGINLTKYREKYNKELIDNYNYKSLIEDGLLKENNNYLYIPEDKLYVSNEIIVRFLQKKI